jgi:nitroreductase
MQTLEALKNRRSSRSFTQQPISADLVEKIIDCARLAPTARNIQPWEFIAVTNKETLNKLGKLADNGTFIAGCSCCIAVFCSDTKYYLEDGCAATENILISAAGLGINSCWVAGDKKPYCEDTRQLLGAPLGYKLVSLIALGYADVAAPGAAKRQLKDVLHWEKF